MTVISKIEKTEKGGKRLRFARGRAKRKIFAQKASIVILDDNNKLLDCSNINYQSAKKIKKVAKSAKILSTNNKRKLMQSKKKGLYDLDRARALRDALSAHLSVMRPKELYTFFRATLKQPTAAEVLASSSSSSSSGKNSDTGSCRGLLLKRTPYKFCPTLALRMQRLLLANLFVDNSLLSLARRLLDLTINPNQKQNIVKEPTASKK